MRWIFRIIGAVVVLACLAIGAVLLIPSERIAQIATERLAEQTGREVEITGAVRPSVWPDLGIVVEGLRIGNADWATEGPMLSAERVNVGVAWAGLLSGDIRVERAEFDGAEVTLMRAADGRVSWDLNGTPLAEQPESGAASEPSQPLSVGFDEAQLRDGRVRYIDLETGADWDVTALDATIRLPEAGGAVSVDLAGAVNGTPLEASGSIDGIADLLLGEVRPVDAAITWQGGRADFNGRLSTEAALEGHLSLDTTDLSPLLALAGNEMPDLPRGLGQDRIAVEGDVTLAQSGSLHLRDGRMTLDDTQLNLALDLLPGDERPLLRGTITGGAISLPGLLDSQRGAPASGAAAPAGSAGWPRDRIDVSGLFAVDSELTLRAETLDLGTVALTDIDMRTTLTRGRLVFDIAQIGAYGGQLAGQFVINGRDGLSVGGDLVLASVQLQPLMTALADYDRLIGTGSASVEFLGVGNDLYTIIDGLEAEGDLSFGAGAIEGLDLAGMIRNFDASFRGEGARTVYDSVTANFLIRDGVLSNDDLLLDAPWGEVRGEGQADLAAMTVDYQVTPGVLRDDSGAAGFRVPILIRGPWSAPSFRPDLEALAEQELADEAAALEAAARERLEEEENRLEETVRDRANELLGVEIEAGDSRDDIQRQLEEGAVNGLQRLLFGGGGADATTGN
ncbi:AsmA family protein [Gymnodinialimonas sp. 2305UL16-5]|uniref:AsmA family protein n=1 Tax=Gymnodinialimonas mytili TaxID=3126503 RepID=UPI0030B6DBA6